MTAGQSFVKAIKPLGCVLGSLIPVCRIHGVLLSRAKAPLGDKYTRPQTTEYYSRAS